MDDKKNTCCGCGGCDNKLPTKCVKCGISLESVMCYSCPNNDCPCGLGGVTC